MKISFQTILLVIFGFFIVFGVAVFAGYINIGSSSSKTSGPAGTVLMWGTVNRRIMESFFVAAAVQTDGIKINYVEKNPATYESELVAAFASAVGPDIFMVTPEILWKQRDKMYEIPYKNYPIQNYTSSYMDVAKAYLTPTGILAFPLFYDPLVGYWNKDIFASAGMATPPKEWKEFPEVTKKIAVVTNDYQVERSAFALGEYTNIRHAKDILSMLFLQAGDPITHVNADKELVIDLGRNPDNSKIRPAVAALDFYTQFANPTKQGVYNWNKSFASDYDQFLAGDLAYYFGSGSELATIRRANPNLNFDMAFPPQADFNSSKTTVGSLYGVAVSKQSKNLGLAYYVTGDMVYGPKNTIFLTGLQKAGLTVGPVRRDSVPNDPSNIYAPVLYQSALVGKTWIDPNTTFTSDVWRAMVGDVQSGKSTSGEAVADAIRKMTAYLKAR
ncbi:MAG: extracellular solute-binding protein [Candidatus Pacebacteria bacterium]|nr:extracellular solute-binding protein [Candidatus Paceibacterota bacterium]